MSHFKAKMLQIRFPASVRPSVRFKLHLRDGRTDGQYRPSVRPSLRWRLTLTVAVVALVTIFVAK